MSKVTLVEQSSSPSTPSTDKVTFYAKTDRMLYNKDDSGLEVRVNEVKGADVASASTINLDSATGNLVDVTGTTTITAITLSEGKECVARFTGALTLTHGASLVLPNNGNNITTAAGDIAVFRGYASSVVRCIVYQRLNGGTVSGQTVITLGTEQASTSGSAIDFTAIPQGTKQIIVTFEGVSASSSGSQSHLIQIGDSGGVETSGYESATSVGPTESTSGFIYYFIDSDSTPTFHGAITLSLKDSTNFTWVASGVLYNTASTGSLLTCAGAKSLSAELDRVRITLSGGTFDAGSLNILYVG